MDIATSSQQNEDIDNQIEHVGEYKQEVLIDKKKLKRIQKEKFNLSNYIIYDIQVLFLCFL